MSQYKQPELKDISLSNLILQSVPEVVCPSCKDWGETVKDASLPAVKCPQCQRPTFPNQGVNMQVIDGQARLKMAEDSPNKKHMQKVALYALLRGVSKSRNGANTIVRSNKRKGKK